MPVRVRIQTLLAHTGLPDRGHGIATAIAAVFAALVLVIIATGCTDQSNKEKSAALSASTATSAGSNQDARVKEFLEGAKELDLELGAAQKTDYPGFQKRIMEWATKTGTGITRPTIFREGAFIVRTVEELIDALSRATAGQVVFIEPGSVLDMTGRESVRVPAGVTVASYRDVPTSEGALLYTNDLGATLFVTENEAVINGLNLMGPDPARRTYQLERLAITGGRDLYYAIPAATGIECKGGELLVENCELWCWGFAAVALRDGSRGTVRHCFLHHNQRRGLGYGVFVDEAEALVEGNLFDWSRHCVAGTGVPGTGYEARYNFVFMNMSGHSFDMHGGRDRNDGSDIAGSWAKIHHNIVEAGQFPGVVIRGLPIEGIRIYNNEFINPDPQRTIMLLAGAERIEVEGNLFGVTSTRRK